MNPIAWLALAFAVLLLPLGDRAGERTHLLGLRGRLRVPGSHAVRRRLGRTPMSVSLMAVAALAVVTVRAGPVLGAAAGGTAAAIGTLVRASVRARGDERSAAELLAGVRVMVAEVAAGARAGAALRSAAEVDRGRGAVYERAADAAAHGADAGAVLVAEPSLAAVGHAWTVAAATGAPIGAVLERVVGDLVARREQARSVATALAGPRSSAVVLAALPVLGALLGMAMDADPLGFLFGHPAGQLVCLAGVGLDLAGLFWTRRLAAAAAGTTGTNAPTGAAWAEAP